MVCLCTMLAAAKSDGIAGPFKVKHYHVMFESLDAVPELLAGS